MLRLISILIVFALGNAAEAQFRGYRLDNADREVTSDPAILNQLNFLNGYPGLEDKLRSMRVEEIPGSLIYWIPGTQSYSVFSILSPAERGESISVELIERNNNIDFIDVMFKGETSFDSSLSAVGGNFGLQASDEHLTHFIFEPVLEASGAPYGSGDQALRSVIERMSARMAENGYETRYVNSVRVYRSFVQTYRKSGRRLSAGIAVVSGNGVYTREGNDQRQGIHYRVNLSTPLLLEVQSREGAVPSEEEAAAVASMALRDALDSVLATEGWMQLDPSLLEFASPEAFSEAIERQDSLTPQSGAFGGLN